MFWKFSGYMGLIGSANIGVTKSRQRRGWPCGHDISASTGFGQHVSRPRMGFEVEWNITPSMVEAFAVTAWLTSQCLKRAVHAVPAEGGRKLFQENSGALLISI